MKRIAVLSFAFAFFLYNEAQSESYRGYYLVINKAEILVVDSLYEQALTEYDKAFLMVSNPFAKDYHNAALCAIFSKNYDKAYKYLDKLLYKGLSMDYFSKYFFTTLNLNLNWQNFQHKYNRIHDSIINNFDMNLYNELENIFIKDQHAAIRAKDKLYVDTFAIVVFRHFEQYVEIIRNYGFPDENTYGVINIPNFNPMYYPLLHYLQIQGKVLAPNREKMIETERAPSHYIESIGIDYSKYNIQDMLKTAAIEGKFPVHYFADMMETPSYKPVKYGCRIYVEVDSNRVTVNYSIDDIQHIDSIRNEIGLESLKDYQKKFYFFESLAENDFRNKFVMDFQGSKMTYNFIDNEKGKIFLKKLIETYNGFN
jgi:hypothetical protein